MKEKSKTLLGCLAVLAIGLIEFISVVWFYRRVQSGTVISVRLASGQPTAFLCQCLLDFLIPAALLLFFVPVLKKDFASELYFKLQGNWQRISAAVLIAAILGLTMYGLIVKPDKAAILLSLFYYLVIISFAEEFVIHDACTWFLRHSSWPLRYLLPNILFGALHLFMDAGWAEISAEVLLRFLFSGTFLGYVFGGCLFQVFKEKSGTIWLPVLLHGLMDYTGILTY